MRKLLLVCSFIVLVFFLVSCNQEVGITQEADAFRIGSKTFATLQNAVDYLSSDSRGISDSYTITLMRSVSDRGAVISNVPAAMKIEFGSFSYILENSGIGIIIEDSNRSVEISGGTITTGSGNTTATLIISRSETLITGTSIDVSREDKMNAIEVSKGTLEITGNTKIKAGKNSSAIRVKNDAVVEVKSKYTEISGNIELSGTSVLKIEHGSFEGGIFLSGSAELNLENCSVVVTSFSVEENSKAHIVRSTETEIIVSDPQIQEALQVNTEILTHENQLTGTFTMTVGLDYLFPDYDIDGLSIKLFLVVSEDSYQTAAQFVITDRNALNLSLSALIDSLEEEGLSCIFSAEDYPLVLSKDGIANISDEALIGYFSTALIGTDNLPAAFYLPKQYTLSDDDSIEIINGSKASVFSLADDGEYLYDGIKCEKSSDEYIFNESLIGKHPCIIEGNADNLSGHVPSEGIDIGDLTAYFCKVCGYVWTVDMSEHTHSWEISGSQFENTFYHVTVIDYRCPECGAVKTEQVKDDGCEYDEEGKLLSYTAYDIDGNVIYVYEYEYDNSGNPIIETDYDPTGSITAICYFTGDINTAVITSETYYENGIITGSSELQYNDDNLIVKWYYYDAEGALSFTQSIEYNSDGYRIKCAQYDANDIKEWEYDYAGISNNYLTKQTWFNSDGSVSYIQTYQYDSNGKQIGYTRYNSDGTIRERSENEYNSSGYRTKQIRYDATGNKTWEYEYLGVSNNNYVTKLTRFNSDGTVNYYQTNEYDSDWNNIRTNEYDADGNLRYYYESDFDSNGNEIEYRQYTASGTLDYRCEYELNSSGYATKQIEYDSEGNKTGETILAGTSNWRRIKYTGFNSDGSVNSITEYDTNGNQSKYTQYNSDGSLNYYQTYQYDSNGKQIGWTQYNSDGSFNSRNEQEYNSAGYRIKRTQFDVNNNKVVEYEYAGTANNNKTLKQTRFNSDGTVSYYQTYQYDSNGNQIGYTRYNSDGTFRERYENEYNSSGYQIKRTQYDVNGIKVAEYEYAGTATNNNTVKQTWFNSNGSVSSIAEYDANGNRFKYTQYNSDGSVNYYQTYQYDSNGNQIGYTRYNSDGTFRERYENEYNASGYLIKRTQYDASGNKIWEYEYAGVSNNNYTTKQTRFNSDGTIDYYETSEYDSNGNNIRINEYDADGNLRNYYESDYDSDGHEVEYRQYSPSGELEWRCEYERNESGYVTKQIEYDAEGNKTGETILAGTSNWRRIKYTRFNSDGSVNSITEYDTNGKQSKYTQYNSDGSINYYQTYEYDLNGNNVRINEYNADSNLRCYYDYDYDSNGNQIGYTICNSDGSFRDRYEIEYNSSGSQIKKTQYDENGNKTWELEYSGVPNNNYITKRTRYNSDGSISSWNEYERDSDGKCILQTTYNSDGTITYYQTYEYDTNGNEIGYSYYNSEMVFQYKILYEFDSSGKIIGFTKVDEQGNPI